MMLLSARSSEPLLQSLRQHAGATLIQQDHTPAVHVGIQLDVAVALADDKVREPARATVLRAAHVDHAAAAVAAMIVGHVPTVAPRWNNRQGLTVASQRGGETGDTGRT